MYYATAPARKTAARTQCATPQKGVKANIVEASDYFKLVLATPGLSKEDLGINIEDDLLTVSTKVDRKLGEGESYTHREFGVRSFSRDFKLPKTVDVKQIDASVRNGVLTIRLPKHEEAAPRMISIA